MPRWLSTRSMYSPVSVLTLIFSPSPTNWGTITVSPVSVLAGLNEPVAVAPFRLGSVSTMVSTTLGGQLHADRALVVEVHLHLGVGQQVLRLALEEIGRTACSCSKLSLSMKM